MTPAPRISTFKMISILAMIFKEMSKISRYVMKTCVDFHAFISDTQTIITLYLLFHKIFLVFFIKLEWKQKFIRKLSVRVKVF